MKVYENLMNIQAELKAPKGQFNKFGNYHYRNSEDILEALKPLLLREKCIITISDNIDEVGGRIYVRACVTLINVEDGTKVETTAFAREDDVKKGFDAPQVTGSSSSYARKYALNAMFCIDDTKDSDYTNEPRKDDKKPEEKKKEEKKETAPDEFTVAWEFLTEEQKKYFGKKYPRSYDNQPQTNPKYFKKTEKEAIIKELKEKGIVK